jgi:hypothetical protein
MSLQDFVQMKKKNAKVIAFCDNLNSVIPQGLEEVSEEVKEAHLKGAAYQRAEDKKKVHDVAKSILAGEPSPIPVIFGDRENKCVCSEDVCEVVESVILSIPDGQHRASGAVEAWEEKSDLAYDISVVIILNSTIEQEIKIFLGINKNMKKIKEDLVTDLHSTLDACGREQTLSNREMDNIEANYVVHMLNSEADSPIKGCSKEIGVKSGAGISQGQWIRAIRHLLKFVIERFGDSYTKEEKRRMVATVVKRLMPKCFAPDSEYRLMTTATGANMMIHALAMDSKAVKKGKKEERNPMGILERILQMRGASLLSNVDAYVDLIKGTCYTDENDPNCPWSPDCDDTNTIVGESQSIAHAKKFLNAIDELRMNDKGFLQQIQPAQPVQQVA